MATLSEEKYLKAIFICPSTTKRESAPMPLPENGNKASSATDMIKKLFEKGLIDYQKYKGVKLTENELAAVSVIKKAPLVGSVFGR